MASANRGAVFQQIDRLYREGTLSGLDDRQLLERYLSRRDEAAFEALVKLHGPMVLGLCRRVLRDPRDVEDAFQATFMILVRKAPTIRDRGLLSNWLYGVAYRVARRARTNTLRRRDREGAVVNLQAQPAPAAADSLEIGQVLDQELNRLPWKYRVPLILCYLQGRTHDQAAEELKCPVGTVRSRLARGRDLLRRRLTSRGHAPTAAILGKGAISSACLLTEPVPPSLISAAVEAALRIGAANTIHASAVSTTALALTQGVLTTMKFAQLKWIGIATLATSLSAGGVIAVSSGAGQNPKAAADSKGGFVNASVRQEHTIVVPFDGFISKLPVMEERLKALEKKLDELLSRSSPVAAAEAAGNARSNLKDSNRRNPASINQDDEPRRRVDPQHRSIQELEAELKLALEDDRRAEALAKTLAIPRGEYEKAHGKVLLIKAMLEGLAEELSDEIDRLKLEINTKRAEREKDMAQTEVASSVVARNTRLNERKAGMVSAEDVARADWEMKVATAQVSIVDAETAEIELRIQQLDRRRARIRQIIKLAG